MAAQNLAAADARADHSLGLFENCPERGVDETLFSIENSHFEPMPKNGTKFRGVYLRDPVMKIDI